MTAQPGDTVRIRFRDHAQEMDGTRKCDVVGVLVSPRRRGDIRVRYWTAYNNDGSVDPANSAHVDLVARAVRRVTVLEAAKSPHL